ncbi:hypothetical protein CB1_001907064 [Camelus ferus]|nr:hypothetical protein CB1_001907064 [Camelus ferus]
MDIEKVNSMDFREFVDVFGNVIERCPLIAAAVWSQRPFSNLEDLEKHFFAFIDALPLSGWVGAEQIPAQLGLRPWKRPQHSHLPAQGWAPLPSDREAVPRELARRLRCLRAQELSTAMDEVKKIGRLRLADLLGSDFPKP